MFHARRYRRFLALLLPLALILTACGGDGDGGDRTRGVNTGGDPGEPQRGGSITYAIEAETGDGWCLQESQLAISGILVARAIYDTLTAPNAEGEYVPYLAEDIQSNDEYTEWTITLRDDVTFHDGSPLTAEVVKNNLDAYRSLNYAPREPLLFLFVLSDIEDVEVTGDLEVTVTTKRPWVAFPAFLHASGRLGIVAQAQLDDPDACDRNLIGTGPFMLEEPWRPGTDVVAKRNPDYWQEAPDGEAYPYLDEIRFQVVIEGEQRVNGIESGDIDLAHLGAAPEFLRMYDLFEQGEINYYESEEQAELTFLQMKTDQAPMDDERVRRAVALSLDPEDFTEVVNQGMFTMATGLFAPGSIGYLEDTDFPRGPALEEARALIAEYEEENGPIPPITYQATPGSFTQQVATYVQQRGEDLGIDVRVETVQQDVLIDNAIDGLYEIMGFRNFPGGDPDELYVWFYSGSPVNFSRIKDPEVDRLLDEGRSEPDPAVRAEIYQDLNRRFSEKVWAIWANYTTWMVAGNSSIFGYHTDQQPALPNGDAPARGLATGHPLHGIWTANS